MTVVGRINWFKNVKFQFNVTRKGVNSGKITETSVPVFSGSVYNKKTGKYIKLTNTQKYILKTISKAINLVQTPGFKTYTAAFSAIAAGVGALGYSAGKKHVLKQKEEKASEDKIGK